MKLAKPVTYSPEDNTYLRSFKAFVNYTDEKRILANYIKRHIQDTGAKILLDIGAGDGTLAELLLPHVQRYEAIESNPLFANLLALQPRTTVHTGAFPQLKLDQQFPLVISSYSLPFGEPELSDFIQTAWQHVEQNGTLLIITYGPASAAWRATLQDLEKAVGLEALIGFANDDGAAEHRLDKIMSYLEGLGNVASRTLKSTIHAKNPEQLTRALIFPACAGVSAASIVCTQHPDIFVRHAQKGPDGYTMPFYHYAFAITKLG